MVILGGGPGGYEAALVASQLGGRVALIDPRGLGGSAVLTDVVPSKSLIATSDAMTRLRDSAALGLRPVDSALGHPADAIRVDLAAVNRRLLDLAAAQSRDIEARLASEGVEIVHGNGRLEDPHAVVVETPDGERRLPADIVLIATGTRPRELPDATPDGQRILNWTQLYGLSTPPSHLIVVGSGVTGAEFASAYNRLGVGVTLVSSRAQVLPGEDPDAARVLQEVFEASGMAIRSGARAVSARREGDGVVVGLADGSEVHGSHVLMAVGSIPNTRDIGLESCGVTLKPSGHIEVDGVSRTSVPGIYAAGDCTGVFPLASVAAMQGRIAMWHALGDSVTPLDLTSVASNVFTSPEIATVGVTQRQVDAEQIAVRSVVLELRGNARAKMQGNQHGFVKLFCLPATGIIVGGVVVAPGASELIYALSLCVSARLTVDQAAQAFTVYPSLSGSIAEAGRRLHTVGGLLEH
ncbi:NAD(P)H-quinone dehydrogenase [Brooklawnia cerclae]